MQAKPTARGKGRQQKRKGKGALATQQQQRQQQQEGGAQQEQQAIAEEGLQGQEKEEVKFGEAREQGESAAGAKLISLPQNSKGTAAPGSMPVAAGPESVPAAAAIGDDEGAAAAAATGGDEGAAAAAAATSDDGGAAAAAVATDNNGQATDDKKEAAPAAAEETGMCSIRVQAGLAARAMFMAWVCVAGTTFPS